MKKICFCFILLMMEITNVQASERNIVDIENHWAKESIVRMITNEKVNGYPDNTFRPNNEITILEFIKMMMENLNIKIEQEGLNKWPDYYIATAKKYHLDYDYHQLLTRYEAIEIISSLIDVKSISNSSKKFKDVSSKYQPEVSKLHQLKIIKGYSDGTFRGENNITRAEAVTIVLRTVEAYQKIINSKKYKIDSAYTNIDREAPADSEINKIRYEIRDKKIYFYDNGRFSDSYDYTINEKYITNEKLIKIIENLVSENSYTAAFYVPSKYIINQVLIKYGESDDAINHNLDYFSFTYFEDKLYDLNRITLKECFSRECYFKISIKKMWKELYQFENRIYIDEDIRNKLLKSLKIEFGREAEDIMNYMLEKYENSMIYNEEIAEQIQIGKYIINTYKTDVTSLEFYFEKLSS
ncbi:MAG: S-layer homology domain-containing protein [Clostridia bacterium]|nr:S-layer homology domain-containing protein [Clostridia bacterium]